MGAAAGLCATLAGLVATAFGRAPLQVPLLSGPGVGIHLRDTAASERSPTIETHFSPWARTDWLRTEAQDLSWVFVEGRFVARSVAWDGRSAAFTSPRVQHLARLKRLQWRVRGPATTGLIVGAGAGFDVAVALQEKAAHITAVELNPATVAFARRDGARNGQIFDRPEVTVVTAEARRWLERSAETFEHIQLALMETAPGGVRGRATAHGRLLTTEALQLWTRRLHREGVLALLFNTETGWRAAIAQLTDLIESRAGAGAGATPRANVWSAYVPGARADQDPFSHLVLYSPTPWTAAERQRLAGWSLAAGATVMADDAAGAAPSGGVGAGWTPLTDDRPLRFDRREGSLALLLAGLAGLLSLLLARTCGRIALPSLAATTAGAASAWLQVAVVEWLGAATGAPSLALGVTIAALLLGAALGTLVPWRGRSAWFAAVAAVGIALILPALVPLATTLGPASAVALLAAPLGLLALPLGMPWLAAVRQAAAGQPAGRHHRSSGAPPGHASEGFIVAADGLGAVIGAGTSGLLIDSLGLQAMCGAAAMLFLGVALLLRAGR